MGSGRHGTLPSASRRRSASLDGSTASRSNSATASLRSSGSGSKPGTVPRPSFTWQA
ncbi:Uncharacterised protein [Bordetella pertussis]|nr:Uncharacterised protein [Bordetella pertussis]